MLTNILPKTTYDFSNLAATLTAAVPVALNIPTTDARELVLLPRIHSVTWSTNADITFDLKVTAPSDFDPNGVYRASAALVTVNVTQPNLPTSSAANFMKPGSATSGVGAYADLIITFKQATSVSTYIITVSVDVERKR